jgi:hypothetical protein
VKKPPGNDRVKEQAAKHVRFSVEASDWSFYDAIAGACRLA